MPNLGLEREAVSHHKNASSKNSVLNLGVVGHGGANNAGGPKDLT